MTPGRIPLTHRQRQCGIVSLIISNFFSWGGFLLLIPLVMEYYVDNLGWAAGTIGLMRVGR